MQELERPLVMQVAQLLLRGHHVLVPMEQLVIQAHLVMLVLEPQQVILVAQLLLHGHHVLDQMD
jgi:hypothetical protein